MVGLIVSVVVVGIVALLAYLYVRNVRGARRHWLRKLNLTGHWHGDQGDVELHFTGQLDQGAVRRVTAQHSVEGAWQLRGHTLVLRFAETTEQYDLSYFKAGSIGLENEQGVRQVFVKETDNVVRLDRVRH